MARIVTPPEGEHIAYCDFCGCKFAYVDSEVVQGHVECPNCGEIKLVDNSYTPFVWPNGFEHTSSATGALDVPDEVIQREIADFLSDLKKAELGSHKFFATGNLLIVGVHLEDGITIWITKDYYEQTLFMN